MSSSTHQHCAGDAAAACTASMPQALVPANRLWAAWVTSAACTGTLQEQLLHLCNPQAWALKNTFLVQLRSVGLR